MADHTTPHQSFETGVSTRPLVRRYTNEPARGGRSGGRLYLACGRGGAATQEPSLGTSRTARAYGWAALPGWSGSGRSHGSRLSPTRIGVYRSRARHSSSFGARGPECTREERHRRGSRARRSAPFLCRLRLSGRTRGAAFLALRPACVHILTGSESQRDQAGRTCSTEFALASPLPPQSIHICIGRKGGVRGGSAGDARRDSK